MKKRPLRPEDRQTFNDGKVDIYRVRNIAPAGEKPVEGLSLFLSLAFDDRYVGLKRRVYAMQFEQRLDRLIRTPRHAEVSTGHIAVINGDFDRQYTITDIKPDPAALPEAMDISLQLSEKQYKIQGGDANDEP